MEANSEDLSGTVVIITGGSRGLGRAMTEALRDAGASVAVLARDTARLDELQAASGDTVITMSGDVSREDDLNAFVDRAVDAFGRIDVVISNAAVGSSVIRKNWSDEPVRFWEISPDQFRWSYLVNAVPLFVLAKRAVPAMVERGWGRVIGISTNLDTMTRFGQAIYGPSKAAQEALCSIMSQDLEGSGVTVNAILPGGPADTDAIPTDLRSLGTRLIRPEQMGYPAVFLASHASDALNGKRFKANLWDETLPPAEAAAAAGSKIAWATDRVPPKWAVEQR